eukprot:CAMPEP_0118985788 /NCGR_PEP_ID=MMETSP1173-20130426/40790_1 /TAXON_ID=1034831 /ORGANISM="Rhizochromulina marina cf, Strain CCMP1243" /LENGTH=42 /DNA_ID= /DNA_START= /DNA_END= /DNA_ORIENTATION=
MTFEDNAIKDLWQMADLLAALAPGSSDPGSGGQIRDINILSN